MGDADDPQWVIKEEATQAVIVALYVRQALGIRGQHDLPTLRSAPVADVFRPDAQQSVLERQWQTYWDLAVEPLAHPAPGPLDLVDGFDSFAVLPVDGSDELREAMTPLAKQATVYAREAREKYVAKASRGDLDAMRPYFNAITAHERQAGRPARSFELTVQILPLTQRGIWWIGSLTVAVTDSVRNDVVAFDAAISPVISELG